MRRMSSTRSATSSATSAAASRSGGIRSSAASQRLADRRSSRTALVATDSSQGSTEWLIRRTWSRLRHAVRNVDCVASSAIAQEAATRKQWLYTAFECRSKSTPNAAWSPFTALAHSSPSVA
jgi:hypothetical protein